MGAHDGQDQFFVADSLGCITAVDHDGTISGSVWPRNSNFPFDVISHLSRQRNCEPVAGYDDALNLCDTESGIIEAVRLLLRCKSRNNRILNQRGWYAPNRSRAGLPCAQHGRADVKAVSNTVFTRKARPHQIALVVVELTLEQGAAVEVLHFATVGIGLEQGLNPFKDLLVENGLLLALEPFSTMVNFANVDPVL